MSKNQQMQLEGMMKQLKELIDSNQGAQDRIRSTFDSRVKELQEGNEKKLDEMRKSVDEKLHDTLEKQLGESFKLVGDRLEAVHKWPARILVRNDGRQSTSQLLAVKLVLA